MTQVTLIQVRGCHTNTDTRGCHTDTSDTDTSERFSH